MLDAGDFVVKTWKGWSSIFGLRHSWNPRQRQTGELAGKFGKALGFKSCIIEWFKTILPISPEEGRCN